MNPQPREVTFVVRMWLLGESENDPQWRGSVMDVRSGKRLFVTGATDVASFIASQLDEREGEAT